jgi:hypothetical protein
VAFVKVGDNVGNVDSVVWSFEVDTTEPVTPVLLSPDDSSWFNETVIAFEWGAVAKLTPVKYVVAGLEASTRLMHFKVKASPMRYVFQADTSASFGSPMIVDTTVLTVDTLNFSSDKYYWRVCGLDSAGNAGQFSAPFWFAVDTTDPVIDSTTVWDDTTNFWGPFEVNAKASDNSSLQNLVMFHRTSVDTGWVADTMVFIGGDWYMDSIPAQTPQDSIIIDYYLSAEDIAGNSSRDPDTGWYSFVAYLKIAAEELPLIPEQSVLFTPVPNPFLTSSVIRYGIAEKTSVVMKLCDISGRVVKILHSGSQEPGYHKTRVDCRELAEGIYFVRFEAGDFKATKKLLLVR